MVTGIGDSCCHRLWDPGCLMPRHLWQRSRGNKIRLNGLLSLILLGVWLRPAELLELVPGSLERVAVRLLFHLVSLLVLLWCNGPFSFGDPAVVAPKIDGVLDRVVGPVSLQVGACLQRHWVEWERLGAGEWVVKTLRYGYVLPFLRYPPLSGAPVEFPSYAIGTEKYSALSLAVAGMIEKGAIEPVLDGWAGFYARVFLA